MAEGRTSPGESVRHATRNGAHHEHVEGRIEVEREPPAAPEIVDLVAGLLGEPAGERVVARQVRQSGEARDFAYRDHVGRIPIVRERPALTGGRDRHELRCPAPAQQRHRARAEHDEAAAAREPGASTQARAARDSGIGRVAGAGRGSAIGRGTATAAEPVDQGPQPLPEGQAVGPPGIDAHVVRTHRAKEVGEPLGVGGAGRFEGALEITRRRARRRVQDSDRHVLHPATVAGPARQAIEVAMARRVRAYVGLGANVGDARRTLNDAVAALAALPGARLRGVSRLYRTRPVGVTDQPDFLNAVVALDVPAGPDPASGATDLLVALKGLEREAGRRNGLRWGPRELDLDLLVFGRHQVAVERPAGATPLSAAVDPGAASRLLEVPHPSMRDRLFVLAPLADLAPGLVPPGWRVRVGTARATAVDVEGPDAAVPAATWNGRSWMTSP